METSLNLDNPRKTGVVGHLQHAAQHFNSVQLNFINTTTVAWRRLILKDKCSTILKRNKENPNNHMTHMCKHVIDLSNRFKNIIKNKGFF